jgi:hypothetical protein
LDELCCCCWRRPAQGMNQRTTSRPNTSRIRSIFDLRWGGVVVVADDPPPLTRCCRLFFTCSTAVSSENIALSWSIIIARTNNPNRTDSNINITSCNLQKYGYSSYAEFLEFCKTVPKFAIRTDCQNLHRLPKLAKTAKICNLQRLCYKQAIFHKLQTLKICNNLHNACQISPNVLLKSPCTHIRFCLAMSSSFGHSSFLQTHDHPTSAMA